jgi:hypothetical protein
MLHKNYEFIAVWPLRLALDRLFFFVGPYYCLHGIVHIKKKRRFTLVGTGNTGLILPI